MSGLLDTFSEMTAGIRCLPDFLKPTDSGSLSLRTLLTLLTRLYIKVQYCKCTLLSDQTKQANIPFSHKSLEWGLYCCTTSTPPYAARLNSPLKSLPAALDH